MGRRLRPAVLGLAGIVLFLVAVRILGTTVEWMAPAARDVVPRLVVHPVSALGAGWILSYVLFNGSVAAALAITLASGSVLDADATFLMLAGSRLGAASFVILVGFLDYYRSAGRQTLRGALSLGLLTFLVTHTVYLPAAGLGLLGIRRFDTRLTEALGGMEPPVPSLEFIAPAVRELLALGGAIPVFLLALALLVAAVRIADRSLRGVDREGLRDRYLWRLGNRWVSFGLGLLLTLLTASVAFSVGILVPLYNRGHLTREEAIPYLLGANLGTLADTFLVAAVLGTETGGAAVLALFLAAGVLTMAALLTYRPYLAVIDRMMGCVTSRRLSFLAFAISLVAVPLLLGIVPLL
jgi:sodium-dependent phosphate cotransporter